MPMKLGQTVNYKKRKFCAACGKELIGWRQRHQKTCSMACGLSIRDTSGEKNGRWAGRKFCSVCGNELAGQPRQNATCSLACSIKLKMHVGENHPRWAGKKSCTICGKEIVRSERRRNKTCSSECASKLRKRSFSKENHPQWKGGVVFCKECGVEIRHTRRLHTTFCSRACMGKWNSENKSRENSPLWKGGSAYQFYPIEFNAKLRSQIRKRDGNKCILCQKRAYDLDVHHIDEDKYNSSPKNLTSLCRSCHRKVHWHPDLLKSIK